MELREVLSRTASDLEVLHHANEHHYLLVTCNRDDFLALAATHPNPGLVVLIRRRTRRQAECGRLLSLLRQAEEDSLQGNVNFA